MRHRQLGVGRSSRPASRRPPDALARPPSIDSLLGRAECLALVRALIRDAASCERVQLKMTKPIDA